MKTKYCITLAGVPGSSKSPIAHHLGWNLGLPIFNNDTLRTEVREDLGKFDQTSYEMRRDERTKLLLDNGISFIYDTSVDRFWETHSKRLVEAGYEVFIISLDLTRDFINALYEAKGYQEYAQLDIYIPDHEDFLVDYGHLVNLHIDDGKFSDRLNLSLSAVKDWINQ